MLCLGIESTAHTFGVGIVNESGKVLSNVRSVYKPAAGGIHPTEAQAQHLERACETIKKSLEEAKIKISDVDVFTFSAGPGIPKCLRVGAVAARMLAQKFSKPIIPANHCIAHIEIGKVSTGLKDPVTLYVSGGNTQILAFAEGRYRVFGETQDIGVGNLLDQFARTAGLQFPGGPEIEKLSLNGKKFIELPYVVKGMDVSFSGILTDAEKKLQKEKLEDLCFSLQENVFAMLVETTERAMAHTEKNECLLTGGVAANKRLAEMLKIMCKERGAKFAVVPRELACDNGAMIAWAGMLEFLTQKESDDFSARKNPSGIFTEEKKYSLEETKINRFWRSDDVDVNWL